jgi:hypothetical protein
VGATFVALSLVPLCLAACADRSSGTPALRSTAARATEGKTLTIKVNSVPTLTTIRHQTPGRVTAGDWVSFKDVLLNLSRQLGKRVGERVGTDTGTMTFTSKTTATVAGVATLLNGTIRFSGDATFLPGERLSVPVVGGTAGYAGARGTLVIGYGSTSSVNTYTLVIGGTPGLSA